MSNKIISSKLLTELSAEEQEVLAGGRGWGGYGRGRGWGGYGRGRGWGGYGRGRGW
ncbi:hypothetical protein [Anabaena lutea]|uniref:Bacteriocin n=1 Tax=Anabaena lutea FACHB-196 TaxID=2692881 RepID=A0ABR8FAG3_9NOST|nr:hypothetical protein [Anabaena lutea]MBD2567200.1 hypothetical protein [Anabaena lutea FACHB-196]